LNDSTLAIVGLPNQDGIPEMFSLGVNFVLYKPVSHDRALTSLRAARSGMRKEKRRSASAMGHAHATVDYAYFQHEKATLIDLAERTRCPGGSPRRKTLLCFPFLKGGEGFLLLNPEGEMVGVKAFAARAPESPVFRKCDVSAIFTDLSSVTEHPHQSEFRVARAVGASRVFVLRR
jgi:hypothetical protein